MSIKPEHKPHILLTIAIAAAVYIFATGPYLIHNIPILLTQVFGILLILWALLSISINKHHGESHHLPNGIFLVIHGPYEIIRHPIYAGILLLISGYVQGHPSLLRYVVFTVLFVALLLKLLYEEEVTAKLIKEYESYKKKTHKLIPYLY